MEEYTAEATLIRFPKPIPLIRIPIPTNPTHGPNPGPNILAFPNPTTFLNSISKSQSNLTHQCLSGSRVGCSISASKKCTPPFWKRVGFQERADCEDRVMNECLLGVNQKCVEFGKGKCLGPFMWAWVRVDANGLGLFQLLGFGAGSGLGLGCDDELGYVRGSVILERSDLDG